MKFDFDKAKAALTAQATAATDPTAKTAATAALAFLDNNQAQLVALGEDAIMQIVNAYLSGNDTQAVTTFYNLNQQAANMVANSADVAQRQYDSGQRAMTAGRFVTQILVACWRPGWCFNFAADRGTLERTGKHGRQTLVREQRRLGRNHRPCVAGVAALARPLRQPPDAGALADTATPIATGMATVIGGVMAIYGRLKADKVIR